MASPYKSKGVNHPIITLTTDFGLRDPYVAEMKGVILDINPRVTIVDVSHEIRKFDIRMGAYILSLAAPYFPKNTIHVGVVDPGVGTERRWPIVIRTEREYFVGPDNGLFALAVKNAARMHVRRISSRKLASSAVSSTFHGRDIFAPAAAYLAKGTPLAEFGPKISRIEMPTFASVTRKGNSFLGEVVHIDDFGNIITNFGAKELEGMKPKSTLIVKFGNAKLMLNLCNAYGDVEKQHPLAIVGSHGFLEISVNQSSAADFLNVEVGDKVALYSS